MNRSFTKLNERRSTLIYNEDTINLKQRVQKIRKNSVEHLHLLLEKAQENLTANGMEVILAKDAEKLENPYIN
jgi:L-lactate utilization protein LutB